MRLLGALYMIAHYAVTTPAGWLALLCSAIFLHGAAVAIRALLTAC